MAKEYTVRKGDCISSIAQKHGFFWNTIWNHQKNSELRKSRSDPNVLLAGDKVFVPDKQSKEESAATEKRNRFRRKGVPGRLRIRLLDDEQHPLENAPYSLDIDGKLSSGELDSDGFLDVSIPPDAQSATLIVETEHGRLTYELQLGHIDPWNTVSGAKARLNDLGFFCGEPDDTIDEHTKAAISAFQQKNDLTVDGKLGPETKQKLKEVYGR